MAEFTEVMKQRLRMCEFYSGSCSECSISSYDNAFDKGCYSLIEYHSEEAEKLIMQWAEEHPIKTNADKFREVFGDDILNCELRGCAYIKCSSRDCSECKYNGFWEQEYKEPKE